MYGAGTLVDVLPLSSVRSTGWLNPAEAWTTNPRAGRRLDRALRSGCRPGNSIPPLPHGICFRSRKMFSREIHASGPKITLPPGFALYHPSQSSDSSERHRQCSPEKAGHHHIRSRVQESPSEFGLISQAQPTRQQRPFNAIVYEDHPGCFEASAPMLSIHSCSRRRGAVAVNRLGGSGRSER